MSVVEARRRAQWHWIRGPFFDLALVAFSWFPLYLAWVAYAVFSERFSCEIINYWDCPLAIQAMFPAAILVTHVHRHHTFLLTYGDRQIFQRDRKLLVRAPLVLLAAILPVAVASKLAGGSLKLAATVGISALFVFAEGWTIYHTLMQKFGFMRIYASKLGQRDRVLDHRLFFSWFAVLVCAVVYKYNYEIKVYVAAIGATQAKQLLPPLATGALALLVPALLYASFITFRWLRAEYHQFTPAAVPRLIFALSVLLLMATFAHSLVLGYLLLGFSHATEYMAFSTAYSGKRMAVKRPFVWAALWNVGFGLIIFGFYKLLGLFAAFGIAAGYSYTVQILHFICDGRLWKMTDKAVRDSVLGLSQLP